MTPFPTHLHWAVLN